MSRRPRAGGWPSRCGLSFGTLVEFNGHRKSCTTCKEIWRSKRSENAVKWHREHPADAAKLLEKMHAGRARFREENPEAAMAGIRRWEREKPEEFAARQAKAVSAMAQWQAQNAEKVIEHSRILIERARIWRRENPEAFAEATRKMVQAPKRRKDGSPWSKAEAWLRKTGTLTWDSAQVRCGEERKQVDFVGPDHKIWVEVDGFFHFFELKAKRSRKAPLATVQARDAMLNEEARRRGDVMLLRFSGGCFRSSDGKMKVEWSGWLSAMLRSPIPGIWCCGKLYESVPWVSGGCTILKSPTRDTTSSSPTES